MPAHGSSDLNILVESERTEYGQVEANKTKGFRKMYLAALCALTFPVAMGMAAAYSATATEDMKRPTSRVIATEDEISWIGSLVAIGALIGGLIAGYLCSRFGRKGALIISSAPHFAGWLCIAYASQVWHILLGRLLTGFCAGLICVTVPSYLIEISTPKVRGLLGSSFQLCATTGTFVIAVCGYFMSWNWQAICAAVTSVAALGLMCLVPESPRWLIENGDFAEAVKALTFLHGDQEAAVTECIAINSDVRKMSKGNIKIKELLQPIVYKPMVLSVTLMFFQQACGSNAVLFYTVAIFNEAKSSLDSGLSTIVVDVVLVLATAVSMVLMDRAGRRLLLVVSGLGMAFSLSVLGAYVYLKPQFPLIVSNYSWIPLASIMVYIASMSLGIGPVPWLMMAELSPTRYRGIIGGVTAFFCWGFVFIVTKTFGLLKSYIHDYGAYWLFASFSILQCVFVLVLPETKGKTFEEIQKHFTSK